MVVVVQGVWMVVVVQHQHTLTLTIVSINLVYNLFANLTLGKSCVWGKPNKW